MIDMAGYSVSRRRWRRENRVIYKFEIENFMSLKNVSVKLDPLTIFIGENSSGKSAIFKALVFLINLTPLRGTRGEFYQDRGITLDDLVWSGDAGLPIKFRVWLRPELDQEPDYTLELRKRAEGWGVTYERIRTEEGWIVVDEDHPFEQPSERRTYTHSVPLRATLRYLVNPAINDTVARPVIEPILQFAAKFGNAWRYRPSAIDIASFVQRPTEKDRVIYVRENGWGVAALLQDLNNNPADREKFLEIEKKLCKLFPHIKDIGFENDYLGVRLRYRTNRAYDPVRAPQESDGVLLATFLLWRLHTAGTDMAVCLEEPENGLYPVLLAGRFEMLKKIASTGHQILASTHSPEFLRVLRKHPVALYKDVRLVQFDEGAGTSVRDLRDFRDAARLLEQYQDEMHNRWEPIIENWDKN
jgi:predicted ATPase